MFDKIAAMGKKLLFRKEESIVSAAFVLSSAIFASRILGLVRDRTLAHFFSSAEIGIYFAAFRLPDTIFEILILGTVSSAFIPTFVSYISRGKRQEAWRITSTVMYFALAFFGVAALAIGLFSFPLSRLLAPGFSGSDVLLMAKLTRVLLLTQGFFVLSFFLSAVLKSFKNFMVPAIAPVLYNLGIILGVFLFAKSLGIFAPAFGAVLGAFFHLLVQLPLAWELGFRPRFYFNFGDPGVRKIISLSLPRIFELSALQIGKGMELFLTSLISTASYAYLTFASHLYLLPISLFGVSLAEATLPTLSYQEKNIREFRHTLLSSFRQIVFFVLPVSAGLLILRIPAVRLAFGAARFTWESTVTTGAVLGAFSISIFSQSLVFLFARAFYALKDTLTPVKISLAAVFINISLNVLFVRLVIPNILPQIPFLQRYGEPVWLIAFSYSIAITFQLLVLFLLLVKKLRVGLGEFLNPFLKAALASFNAGLAMYVLLKILDRSAWDRNLSFLGRFGLALPEPFSVFVLDTRYTINLVILTLFVGIVGGGIYLLCCHLLGVKEISTMARFIKNLPFIRKLNLPIITTSDEPEPHP